MLRSMFSGVSGLRGHQTMMDVIGNNIANVNTTGFKSSSVMFQDILSQLVAGAGAATEGTGSTNPAQIGLGSRVAAVNTNFGQGSAQLTGRATDLSIQGDGFFIVETGGQQLYTRAGGFSFDAEGRMVNSDGAMVQGWVVDATTGLINTNTEVSSLIFPPGQVIKPEQTSIVTKGGNLPTDAAVGTVLNTAISVFDTQGTEINMSFTYTKTAADTWEVQAYTPDGPDAGTAPDPAHAAPYVLTFDPLTGYQDQVPPPAAYTFTPTSAGIWTGPVTINFGIAGTPGSVSQFAGQTSLSAIDQNGSAIGSLQSFAISEDGLVTGVFSNGKSDQLGRIAMAAFNNPSGLEKAGGSTFRTTVASGVPRIGTSGTGGRGRLAAGTLEMSNVDLAAEFTNLIIAQRGFQANGKIITASDEILQDLINLKR